MDCWISLFAFKLYIVHVMISLGRAIDTAQLDMSSKLHAHLLKGYQKDVHPVKKNGNRTEPVSVIFDAQVIRILEVNERQQYIRVYLWVNQYWENPLLTWNESEFGGINTIYVSPELVWVPDIVLYNSVDGNGQFNGGLDVYKHKVQINSNGKHTWLNPVVFQKICQLDVSYFPFDDQECKLKFGSWAFDATKVITKSFPNTSSSNNFYIQNGEWELLGIKTEENILHYQCCKNPFSDVTVTIRIRRQAKNHTLTLILPCALLSSLVVLGFILPPESGERIGLSITVLLSVTVFQQLTSQIMPPYDFPYLAQYYMVTIMQTAFSLVTTTLILNIYHRSNRRMPKWAKKVLLHWLAPLLFFQWSKKEKCDDEEQGSENIQRYTEFAMTRLGAETSFMNGSTTPFDEQSIMENGDGVTDELTEKHQLASAIRKKINSLSQMQKQKSPSTSSLLRNTMHHTAFPLLSEEAGGKVEEYETVRKKEISREQRAKDWFKAARVLDRFFFLLYVIISTTTLLAIFLRAPRFAH